MKRLIHWGRGVVIDKINVTYIFILLYIFFASCYTRVTLSIKNTEKSLGGV